MNVTGFHVRLTETREGDNAEHVAKHSGLVTSFTAACILVFLLDDNNNNSFSRFSSLSSLFNPQRGRGSHPLKPINFNSHMRS